jgi:type IV secretion system protein VirB4
LLFASLVGTIRIKVTMTFNMLNKYFKNKKKSRDIKLEVPVPDFIPYACHYGPNTVLTKNGELLQTIRITGFSSDAGDVHQADLRNMIRQAVLENIKTDDFALWFHTVRRKSNLDPGGDFKAGFASKLNDAWKRRNKWEATFVNEVYITLVRDGIPAKLTSPGDMVRSLYFGALRAKHQEFLEESHEALQTVVDDMLETLADFGAKRLSISADEGVYYSDPLQFFSKILNLAEFPVPMPLNDISEYLASHNVAIGFDTMEVRGKGGKQFGAAFVLKQYAEIPVHVLDKFLQLPQEFIITQTLDFISSKVATKDFKKQRYMLQIGRDDEFAEAIGLDYVLESDGSANAFGNSQITIYLINNDLKSLNKNIADAFDRLGQVGLLATRCDLRLEEAFWSQLPANFSYITRKHPISTSLVAGFASLYNFPAGLRSGNLWGPAVSMFHTDQGTPYFFSFHQGDNGHTAILGPRSSGKTVLMNFLIAESRKFNGRLFMFEQGSASKIFINAMKGRYATINPEEAAAEYAFNPLLLDDSPENRKFLHKWLIMLAESSDSPINDVEKKHLGKLVDYVYSIPDKSQRRIGLLANSFGAVSKGSLGERMSIWYGEGKYAHLFDNDLSSIEDFNNLIYGFGMGHVVKDKICLGPLLSYLFHRIETELTGIPTIIVLDEAWKLVNNPIFAPGLIAWLERLKQKNALVIFATETVPNSKKHQFTHTISEAISTQIFLPNLDAEQSSVAYKEVWGLSDEEFKILLKMRPEKRQFMFRQGGSTMVAALDLKGLKEVGVLSGNEKTVTLMESIISEQGDNPEDWLPVFYERTKNQQ